MKKWVLYFQTKEENLPTPFRKVRIPRHDSSTTKAFVTMIEAETEERAWDHIFACCPGYRSLGSKLWETYAKIKNPERPDESIFPSLDYIANHC